MQKIKNARGQMGIIVDGKWEMLVDAPKTMHQGMVNFDNAIRAAKKIRYEQNKKNRAIANQERSLNGGKKGKN